LPNPDVDYYYHTLLHITTADRTPPPDCTPALLLSALNSDDSGTLNILPSLWSVPSDIIQAGFNDPSINTEDLGRNIPEVGTGAIIGSEECKKRCNLQIAQ
jgi:hypothetical protein